MLVALLYSSDSQTSMSGIPVSERCKTSEAPKVRMPDVPKVRMSVTSSGSQPVAGPDRMSTDSSRRPGGFGTISCVICGGKDHPTYSCPDREKRFCHM